MKVYECLETLLPQHFRQSMVSMMARLLSVMSRLIILSLPFGNSESLPKDKELLRARVFLHAFSIFFAGSQR